MEVTATKTERRGLPKAFAAVELLEGRLVLAANLMTLDAASGEPDVEVIVGEEQVVQVDDYSGVITAARMGDPGDFNDDGSIDAVDIDLLSAAIHSNQSETVFDLTFDGLVNMDDMDHLVRNILNTEYGDADLDGRIDMVDFWMMYRNMYSGRGGWTRGDFNIDGQIDGSDFNVWNQYKYFSRSPVVTSAPVLASGNTADPTDEAAASSFGQDESVTTPAVTPAQESALSAKVSVKSRLF